MKIFICSSKHLYHKVPEIKAVLEKSGHKITLPNSYEQPLMEEEMKKIGKEEHASWKSSMMLEQGKKVKENDAILVLNYEKNDQQNYIGGATFLEIFKAFELGKKIFLINPIPENIFKDELLGMRPVILNGDLSKVK